VTAEPDSVLDARFAQAMARFGPFEAKPHLALAVSGGADSMTLALLADRWAQAQGGRVTALTVDHGLRPDSASEARRVGRWLKARGIRHDILRWSPPVAKKKVAGARLANLQAAARDARYALLFDWCRQHAVLHLLLAHHRDDQAETLLLRLARGSGIDGLAAMAPLVERPTVRLLRPLLSLAKTDIVGYLQAMGQPWIEDPSNQDSANARVRIRKLLPRLAEEGMTPARLAETAERLAQARAGLDQLVDRLLATSTAVYPEGYLRLDVAALRMAEKDIALRVLARAIACIGGAPYGPRLERLTRLYDRLCTADGGTALGRGRTLGGCRILPARRTDIGVAWSDPSRPGPSQYVLVVREPAAIAAPVPWSGEDAVRWDGRFLISRGVLSRRTKGKGGKAGKAAVTIGALMESGLRSIARECEEAYQQMAQGLPRDVLVTLPAIRRGTALLAVPHLGYHGNRYNMQNSNLANAWQVRFAPFSALTRPGFTLV
jgi:tRNA(Ile)-lysidine synthase